MQDFIYHVIIFVVIALSGVIGFYRGITRQLPSLIAVAFAIVSTRLLSSSLDDLLYGALPWIHGKVQEQFLYDLLSTTLVFTAVFALFHIITGFIGKAIGSRHPALPDSLAGAVFRIFRNLLFLSIAYNIIYGFSKDSGLTRCVSSDDGNMVEEVMLLSPALLGGEDAIELCHKIQLEEAKKIS